MLLLQDGFHARVVKGDGGVEGEREGVRHPDNWRAESLNHQTIFGVIRGPTPSTPCPCVNSLASKASGEKLLPIEPHPGGITRSVFRRHKVAEYKATSVFRLPQLPSPFHLCVLYLIGGGEGDEASRFTKAESRAIHRYLRGVGRGGARPVRVHWVDFVCDSSNLFISKIAERNRRT